MPGRLSLQANTSSSFKYFSSCLGRLRKWRGERESERAWRLPRFHFQLKYHLDIIGASSMGLLAGVDGAVVCCCCYNEERNLSILESWIRNLTIYNEPTTVVVAWRRSSKKKKGINLATRMKKWWDPSSLFFHLLSCWRDSVGQFAKIDYRNLSFGNISSSSSLSVSVCGASFRRRCEKFNQRQNAFKLRDFCAGRFRKWIRP